METWKDIPGFEGRYQVSDQGRILSLPFAQRYLLRTGVEAFRKTPARYLAQQQINSGYAIVHLHLNRKHKAVTVHSLVAAAFVPGSGKTVNHIDGNKLNNTARNLEWASYTENHLHAVKHGLNRQAIQVKNPTTGEVFHSITQAAKACRVAHRTAAKWGQP